MVLLIEPKGEGEIDIIEGFSFEEGQKLSSYCFEKSFYLSFSLGPIRPGVNQRDAQRSSGELQLARAECGSVVDIELSRQTSFLKRPGEAVHEGGDPLGRIELGVWNQSGMIVNEGDQVAFAPFIPAIQQRTVHDIRLPKIVGGFRFKLSSVRRRRRLFAHQIVAMEESIDGSPAQRRSFRD